MQLWSDDDETEQVCPGENVKIKLKNVEEEVRISSNTCSFQINFERELTKINCDGRCLYLIINFISY